MRHPHLRPPKIAYRVFVCGQARVQLHEQAEQISRQAEQLRQSQLNEEWLQQQVGCDTRML